ncbi:hypothetical protein JW968_03940 [Candidatus Woesearchaeota archaeon]|nr:hypothetical protein [Candidatus Woesearchaeota archaeon]
MIKTCIDKTELVLDIKERIMKSRPDYDPRHAEETARRWVSGSGQNKILY